MGTSQVCRSSVFYHTHLIAQAANRHYRFFNDRFYQVEIVRWTLRVRTWRTHSRYAQKLSTVIRGFTLPQGSYLVHTIPFHATVHVDNVLAADCTVSSNDGCIFVANKQILEGSNPLVRRMCGRDPLTGVFLHLPEDGETTLAMIHAMYPFPTIPIATIDLAEKAVAAAKRYGVNIARLNFETSIFEPARVIAHPIRYCAFTWNIGLRSELESASRYALVQDLTGDFSWALGVPGAMDVLAALALTQLDRREKMDAIVSRLPTNLLCFACRGGGRGGQDEMREVVKMIFGVPNPDLHHILDCEMWAGSILATSCPTSSCGQWLHRFTFSQLSVVELANAATQVPQVIHQVYFDNKQELYQTSQN